MPSKQCILFQLQAFKRRRLWVGGWVAGAVEGGKGKGREVVVGGLGTRVGECAITRSLSAQVADTTMCCVSSEDWRARDHGTVET